MGPDGLDVATDVNRVPVECGPTGRSDRRHDIGVADGTEQLAAVRGGTCRDGDSQPLKGSLHFLGVLVAADLAGQARALDAPDLLLGAAGSDNRLALRKQEVPAVAVTDLDDVTRRAELVDLG